MITKSIIDDTINLCDFIAHGKEDGIISTNTYTPIVSSKLEEFIAVHVNSPNVIFQNELRNIKERNRIGNNVVHQNFRFLGRVVNSYVWSTLYVRNKGYKNSIQLFIIANKEKIEFGLCYGAIVNNESPFVKFVKQNEQIKQALFDCIQSDPNIFFYNSDNAAIPINVNSANELGLLWSSRSNVSAIIRTNEVPDNANEIIDRVLNNLTGVFSTIADSGEIPPIPPPGPNSERYEGPLNIILYGPPGTGKTYNSIDIATKIAAIQLYMDGNHPENKIVFDNLRLAEQIEFVTFHQNYSYEDFMVGIRPRLIGDVLAFEPHSGIFYNIAKRARINYDASELDTEQLKNFVLIIDEINRANISKVFGELITLLEEDKRIGEENELTVKLSNGEDFGVPPNLYIIGTMNTADKSIALVDIALRRRFEFEGFYPREELLVKLEIEGKIDPESAKLLKHINRNIFNKRKSADYLIGHAYFMNMKEGLTILDVLQNKVVPLMTEYFPNQPEIVEEIFEDTDWKVEYSKTNFRWDITPRPIVPVIDNNNLQ
jgi:hypothetical protein